MKEATLVCPIGQRFNSRLLVIIGLSGCMALMESPTQIFIKDTCEDGSLDKFLTGETIEELKKQGFTVTIKKIN